jgi:hypothetical protein
LSIVNLKKEMMKTRIFFMLFAVALLWCGCSKNDDESGAPIAQTDDDDARLIRVSASAIDVTASQSTRAVVEGNAFSGQDARVLAALADNGYADLHCNGIITFTNSTDTYSYGSTTEGSSRYYTSDNKVYLSGLYPSSDWGCDTGTTISNGTVTRVVDGKIDLLYAESVENNKGFATTHPLEFHHVLTLLNLKLAKSVTVPVVVKSISLVGTNGVENYVNYKKCSVNLNTKIVSFSDNNEGAAIPCYLKDDDAAFDSKAIELTQADPSSVTAQAYVLAPALEDDQVDTDKDYVLSISYSIDGLDQYPALVPLRLLTSTSGKWDASTAGQSFDIALTFKGSEITAKAIITQWLTGGKANEDVN